MLDILLTLQNTKNYVFNISLVYQHYVDNNYNIILTQQTITDILQNGTISCMLCMYNNYQLDIER